MTAPPAAHRPWLLGACCGLFAAFGYTITNSCLRAVTNSDPVWASAVKAIPTLCLIGPWLIVLRSRGERLVPDRYALAAIVFGAVLGQLGGNVGFQYALGQIGIGLSVSLTLGGMIISAALLARFLLNEPIQPRTVVALTILLSAVVVLSLGAGSNKPSAADITGWGAASGVAAAIFCGFAYSVLNVAIRWSSFRGVTIAFTLVTVSTVGILSLGTVSLLRIGMDGIRETSTFEWAAMLMAGIWNAAAFLALIAALRMTSVVFVNGINASQSAMAAVAGVLFFREEVSVALIAGVLLTAVGLAVMSTVPQRTAIPPEPS